MLESTGERLLPWDLQYPPNHYEHLQRYYFAAQFAAGREILDLGSGEGYGADILAVVATQVTGIDISPEAVEWALQKYRRPNLRYACGSATDIPISGKSIFDLVVCFEMIEHIGDQQALLREVKRLLKPGGLLIVSTPNKAVYTDEPQYHNPFHVRELYIPDFQRLIESFFPYASYMGQRVHPAAAMWPMGGSTARANEIIVESTREGFARVEPTRKSPMYVLALASQEPLAVEIQKKVSSYFFLLDISDALVKRMWEDAQKESKKGEAGLLAEIRKLSDEVAREERERRRLEGQVAEREGQIVSVNAAMANLNQALAEREGTISGLLQSRSWKVTRPLRFIVESLRSAMPNVGRRLRLAREWWMIRRSGLFDSKSYLKNNRDAASFRWGPLWHYLLFEAIEGHDPHPLFCTSFYLHNNRDVAKAGVNPLYHYLRRGAAEGRDPHPLFDSSYYLEQYPDVAKAGVNPLVHYLKHGAYEGRDPHPNFDSSYYLEQNPDVAGERLNPLAHYVGPGIAEGRDPNPFFDTSGYLEQNPQVALRGADAFVHYLAHSARLSTPASATPPSANRDSGSFDLRAALRNELQLSGRAPLDSDHDSHPVVSVIIPCFNQGHFLEDAVLSSLLACSHPMEIIVVDDGSTDSQSVALVDELAANYKFALVRHANMGLAGARNTGIEHARGKFIQFLDSDDLLAPGKIDAQIDEFRSDSEIDICISEYELCDAEGFVRQAVNPSTIAGFSFSREDFLLRWERGLSIPIHCALFRRELLEKTHFQLVTHTGKEDWIFWVEISSRSPKFKFNPAVLAAYRLHGQNMVGKREEMGLDFLRASMYISRVGLGDCEDFLGASIQHFQTAYLGSIKHDMILWSRTHNEA